MNLDMISSKYFWCSDDTYHYCHRDCKILPVLLSWNKVIKCFRISTHWQFCCMLIKKRNFTARFCWLFARVIHHGLLDSPHKRPVRCESFSCDNNIMVCDKCPLHQGASRTHKGSLVIALSKYLGLNLTIRMTYVQTAIIGHWYKFSYLSHLITAGFILYKV